jgi:hypothetical protein
MNKGDLRYTVSIDVRAAYDTLEISLADLARDHRQELLDLISQLRNKQPKKLEEQIYKCISLDLCPPCQARYIQAPLDFHKATPAPQDPEPESADAPVDIDSFLRSLGFGETPGQD